MEFLEGTVARHGAGYHVGTRALAVQGDDIAADRMLVSVCHQALADHQSGPGRQFRFGIAYRIVHALDLHHLHLHAAALFLVDFGAGI